jgi:hypothetical protein
MINVELLESEEVSRLKVEVFGTSNPDLQPSDRACRSEVGIMPQDMVLGVCPTVTFLLRRTAV